MRPRIAQWTIGLFGSLMLVGIAASSTEACLFHGWFGCAPPSRTTYFGAGFGCAPACPTPYRTRRSFFGGAFFGCPTVCDPCCSVACPTGAGTTGTGGTTGGGTSGGGLQLGEPSSTPQPTPADQDTPRTFREDQTPSAEPQDQPDTSEDSPFAPRESEGFRPTQPSGTQEGPDDAAGQHEAQKVPSQGVPSEDVRESVIRQKKPAPTDPPTPSEEQTPQENQSGPKSIEAKSPKPSQSTGQRVSPAGLDDTITWHATPQRSRLIVRPTFGAPKVVRTKVNVNADWVPGPQGTKVVRK